ncbi:hypothetical protein NE236_41690 [Actinoallomurus purpureus]|uniref:hypothetical protein n=1 Tax=Actinoallomurus purpureus TaxID=478114 RepID=UPI002092954F|nr:hypothetical protein [Actinoallomurus purpureus]MCO6011483.1 hypothetical protein [Actinoallomurus purpureus]
MSIIHPDAGTTTHGAQTALYFELLEAARASIAAARLGEADPLIHVRHVLDAHGQLPPEGMTPVQILALTPAAAA